MSRIAFIHNALGKTDGVSLEVDKWRKVCEKLGHTVFYIAGNQDVKDIICIRELDFFEEKTYKILKNATVELTDYASGKELKEDIYTHKECIKKQLEDVIKKYQIDIIIPNNLMSVGYHIPALVALAEIIKESGVRAILHNHDFYFEDSGEVSPTCKEVEELLESFAPISGENIQNLVINQIAKEELKKRKHIDARIVPNVFDFQMSPWIKDEYNSDFRERMGLKKEDIIFLQATRVLDRKGIELAVDVVAKLNEKKDLLKGKTLYNGKVFCENSNIVLLCCGYIETFGISGNYYHNLCQRAKDKKVDIRFVGDRVKHTRSTDTKGKIYSLWDSYVEADFVTYPSIWEGWGNQFIEAVFAKLPIVLYEYPVFLSDLKKDGFRYISLGNTISSKDIYGMVGVEDDIIEKVSLEIIELLSDFQKRQSYTDTNYNIAKHLYSLEALEGIIKEII